MSRSTTPAACGVGSEDPAQPARLSRHGSVDHSIGTLFLEVAASDADTAHAGGAVVASAIVEDVLPRYFAALGPAVAAAAPGRPEVAVTLVRWPYT
jgi:hypothetical protein